MKDGAFYSVMTGFGESYLGAYGLYLGASNPQIGLLASLPQLVGAFFQFASVRVIRSLQKRKTVIMGGVILQALTWVPIIGYPLFFPRFKVPALIGLAVLYFISGSMATPAWTSLVGDLVHPRRRGRFFGRRNRLISILSFVSLCAGGVILHLTGKWNWEGVGFAFIFILACAARLASAYYVYQMMDPPYRSSSSDEFSVWDFLRNGRRSNFGRFVAYAAGMHFSVQVSGPFLTPYMLRDLHFSYLQFMMAAAASVLAQFLTLNGWGRLADRFGNRKVLQLTGYLLPGIPLLWLLSTHFFPILLIQMFAGFAWAGFSLALGNYLLDVVSPPKRAQCVALYNSANAIGIFLGALLGGGLTLRLPNELLLYGFQMTLVSNLLFLFVLSSVLRFAVSFFFLPLIREVREVPSMEARDLFVRIVQLRPVGGFKFDFFVPGRRNRLGRRFNKGEDSS